MILQRKNRPKKQYTIYIAKELMERIDFLLSIKNWDYARFNSKNHFIEHAIEALLKIEEARYITTQS